MNEAGGAAKTFDPEAVVTAMGPMLGLEIEAAYRPGIAANLEVTARFAQLVLDFPLPDQAEPAAVFRP